ncbi:hypothetical protein STENM327S_05533 [Streptomyces tendae]
MTGRDTASRWTYGGAAGPARSRRQPDGPDGLSAVVDHGRYAWRAPWAGRPLPGGVLYELHVDIHPRGHPRRRRRAPRTPGAPGRHPRRVDAAVPLPRTAWLGVRGGLAVGGARAVRRARGAETVRRPGARARPRRGPGRGAQPPGPQLPARLRPVLHRHPPHALGHRREPGRARLRRGADVSGGQRAGAGPAGLPDRRAAPGRGARPGQHARVPLPGAAVDRRGRPRGRSGPAALPDRRVRPERPADHHPARGRAAWACTRSGTTTSTTRCTPR